MSRIRLVSTEFLILKIANFTSYWETHQHISLYLRWRRCHTKSSCTCRIFCFMAHTAWTLSVLKNAGMFESSKYNPISREVLRRSDPIPQYGLPSYVETDGPLGNSAERGWSLKYQVDIYIKDYILKVSFIFGKLWTLRHHKTWLLKSKLQNTSVACKGQYFWQRSYESPWNQVVWALFWLYFTSQ